MIYLKKEVAEYDDLTNAFAKLMHDRDVLRLGRNAKTSVEVRKVVRESHHSNRCGDLLSLRRAN